MKASMQTVSTINADEAAHFGQLAKDWWDPNGSSAMLHKLNPVRLEYIRDAIDRHWLDRAGQRHPLSAKSALDVGCGAGLLCEPLARMGADVTGIDAAAENIQVASAHAIGAGLEIDYRNVGVETLTDEPFDLVTCMEVIEHVDDPQGFVGGLARALKPDGLMILSTPNRTTMARLMLVEAAERLGQVPRGTHDWDKFFMPGEITEMLNDAGLKVLDITGIAFDPIRKLHLSENLQLNYIMTIVRA